MPAVSGAQRRLMGLAEHHPEKVRAANRGVLKMSHQQLHDFAATKGLGGHVAKHDKKESGKMGKEPDGKMGKHAKLAKKSKVGAFGRHK